MHKSDDPITEMIKCECGKPDCKIGLIVRKYPEDKIKIQIFEGEAIKTVIVNKKSLIKKIKKL